MKKFNILFIVGLFACSASYAQNTFPQTGDVVLSSGAPGGKLIFVDANHAIYGRTNLQGYADAMSFYEYGNIDFYTGGPIANQIQRLRIASNGNVGIGNTNPTAKLHVLGGMFRVERNSTESMADFTNAIDANFDIVLSTGGSADKKAYIGPTTNTNLALGQNGIEAMRITPGGNVAIGTTDPKGNKLAVAGSIIATEVKVKLQSQWPDYVFKPTYRLPSLASVKVYIDKNNHLPDMPSAAEVAKNGVDLGQMNKLLLKKVEELTCYLIAKDTKIKAIEARMNKLEILTRKRKPNQRLK